MVSQILQKYEQKRFDLMYHSTNKSIFFIFFVRFFGEVRKTKFFFEHCNSAGQFDAKQKKQKKKKIEKTLYRSNKKMSCTNIQREKSPSLQSYVEFFRHKSDYVSGHAFVPSHSSNQAFILIQFVHFRLAWTI